MHGMLENNRKVLYKITDKKQNCWDSSCVEIFPPTYLKKWIKFRTTTNRIEIAFSANRPLATHKSKTCEQNALCLMKD